MIFVSEWKQQKGGRHSAKGQKANRDDGYLPKTQKKRKNSSVHSHAHSIDTRKDNYSPVFLALRIVASLFSLFSAAAVVLLSTRTEITRHGRHHGGYFLNLFQIEFKF